MVGGGFVVREEERKKTPVRMNGWVFVLLTLKVARPSVQSPFEGSRNFPEVCNRPFLGSSTTSLK